MQTAQRRDACRKEKFWFRKITRVNKCNGTSNGVSKPATNGVANGHGNTNGVNGHGSDDNSDSEEGEWELMTIDEIFNGKRGSTPGLISLVRSYLQSMEVDTDTHCTIEQYLRFIQKRASGELLTTASWMREQVLNHPEYKHDSVVSESINYDLLKTVKDIQEGNIVEPRLLGHNGNRSKTKDSLPQALQKHLENCCKSND